MSDLKEQLSPQQMSELETLNRAFREVFALDSGKRVLFWMLEQCSIYADAYAGDQTNAPNYTLGLQAGGRKLIAKLDDLDPRLYPTLLLAMGDLKMMERKAAEAAQQENDNDIDA